MVGGVPEEGDWSVKERRKDTSSEASQTPVYRPKGFRGMTATSYTHTFI